MSTKFRSDDNCFGVMGEKVRHYPGEEIPSDKLCLRLLLVNGKTAEFLFHISCSAGAIAETIYHNWPIEWQHEREAVENHHVLRLIYQGRFLHENVTLSALKLAAGRRTVMHMIARENLPQPLSDDTTCDVKSQQRSCCCTVL